MYNNVSVKTNISIRFYVAMQNNVSEKKYIYMVLHDYVK